MILIYSQDISVRLEYIVNFIFSDVLLAESILTSDLDKFINHIGPKIYYGNNGNDILKTKMLSIPKSSFINEVGYKPWSLKFEKIADLPVLHIGEDNLPGEAKFDIFSSAFFIISRYEEYSNESLRDKHGRFISKGSVAQKHDFLHLPILDLWALDLKEKLGEKFKNYKWKERKYSLSVTFDIDIAFKYLAKGLLRNIWGFSKDILALNHTEILNRYEVLVKRKEDPYYCFSYLQTLKTNYPFILKYFFLMGDFGEYDRNISHQNNTFRKLLKTQSDISDVGIHFSYKSHNNINQMKIEKKRLELITLRQITSNRNHYIKLDIPLTYQNLEQIGIESDHTMGYTDTPGFRAGTCTPFYFFSIYQNRKTKVLVHPFQLMDASFVHNSHDDLERTYEIIKNISSQIKKVNGQFSTVWHNHFFNFNASSSNFNWKSFFEDFIIEHHA